MVELRLLRREVEILTAHARQHAAELTARALLEKVVERDAAFAPIVERAAKLICTTPEYDELAREVGLGDHTAGVTEPAERLKLRAELDAMVAHLERVAAES